MVCASLCKWCAKNGSNAYIDIGKSKSVANVLYFAGEHCCKETPRVVLRL